MIRWKQRKTRALSVMMVLLLAATMFSRNYLGVHTPQDVLVGFAIGALAFMPMVLWMLWLKKFAVPLIGTMGVKALTLSVPMIYILAVAPLLLKKLAITSERQA